jgi:uncharacterized protein (DUF1330 family)
MRQNIQRTPFEDSLDGLFAFGVFGVSFIQGEKYTFSFNLTTGKFQAEKMREHDLEEPTVQVKTPLDKLLVESRAEYIALVAGAAIGGAAIQGLHAQAKPPVYVVGENTVTNADAYIKEFVPLARASIKNAGGKSVAASQNVTSLEGAPQKSRVTINVFDSLEKAQAWRTGAEFTAARKIGDKYATFRAYVVEGLPQ